MSRRTRLSKADIRAVANDYERLLPGWFRLSHSMLGRRSGPILQAIWFDALSSGYYRPTHYVRSLVTPGGIGDFVGFLHGVAKGNPHRATLASHASKYNSIYRSMVESFPPSLSEPLDPLYATELCEAQALPTAHEAFALAFLNAYFSRFDRSLAWSARYDDLVGATGQPWRDRHYRERQHLNELASWIDDGSVSFHLGVILNASTASLGIDCND